MPNRFTGAMIIHCHILIHADEGMTMVGKVVNQGKAKLIQKSHQLYLIILQISRK